MGVYTYLRRLKKNVRNAQCAKQTRDTAHWMSSCTIDIALKHVYVITLLNSSRNDYARGCATVLVSWSLSCSVVEQHHLCCRQCASENLPCWLFPAVTTVGMDVQTMRDEARKSPFAAGLSDTSDLPRGQLLPGEFACSWRCAQTRV